VVVDRRTGIPVSGTVSVIDTASNAVVRHIDVGLHPVGMTLSPSGDRLYVTNANSDTVSVIDTASDAVVKTLSVQAQAESDNQARGAILGSSPNAIATSPDGRRLYVANASENAIAVLDPEREGDHAVLGLIPTGWYPTAVAMGSSGEPLYVASGYGFGSIAPVPAGHGATRTAWACRSRRARAR
jgi:YVTN family beta-propeller protein